MCQFSIAYSPKFSSMYKCICVSYLRLHYLFFRDIGVRELVLSEDPYVAGPSHTAGLVCLGCLRSVADTSTACARCGLPLCGRSCPEQENHRPECNFLAGGRGLVGGEDARKMSGLVLSLRYLLKTDWLRRPEVELRACEPQMRNVFH